MVMSLLFVCMYIAQIFDVYGCAVCPGGCGSPPAAKGVKVMCYASNVLCLAFHCYNAGTQLIDPIFAIGLGMPCLILIT